MSPIKFCSSCKEHKELDEFWLRKSRGKGYYAFCKSCAALKQRIWRSKNRAHYSNYMKVYNKKNKPHVRQYGIDLSIYSEMEKLQNGLCLICKEKETRKNRSGFIAPLSVDHCHETGKIRGLLCGKCNQGIGLFKDNVDHLNSAIQYLTESRQ